MTNAEKYIGDEDLIDEFIEEFNEFACKQDWDLEYHELKVRLVEFFKQPIKPTLTEDERVILRNIKGRLNTLFRNSDGYLILQENSAKEIGEELVSFCEYNHLFQFIKERRRIRD